jgi:hypothetical protein
MHIPTLIVDKPLQIGLVVNLVSHFPKQNQDNRYAVIFPVNQLTLKKLNV